MTAPLEGSIVLELANWVAAPGCTAATPTWAPT